MLRQNVRIPCRRCRRAVRAPPVRSAFRAPPYARRWRCSHTPRRGCTPWKPFMRTILRLRTGAPIAGGIRMADSLNPRQRHPNLARGDAAQLHWAHQQLAVAERIHRQRLLRPRHRGQNQHPILPRQRHVATAPPQYSLVPIWYFHQKPISLQLGAVLPIPPREIAGNPGAEL